MEVVGPQELRGLVAHDEMTSSWVVPQVRAVTSPYGQPGSDGPAGLVVDPCLVLGITGALLPRVVRVGGRRHALNYGLDDVRFRSPLAHGDRLRMAVRLDVVDGPGEWLDARWATTTEGPSAGRVLISAVLIVRYFFDGSR